MKTLAPNIQRGLCSPIYWHGSWLVGHPQIQIQIDMSLHSNLNPWQHSRKVYYRKRLRKSNSKAKLPQQIVLEDILPRLPVRSVLRFKTASKNWYDLLSTPQISKLHYQRATQQLRGQKVFFLIKNYVLCLDVETLFDKGYPSKEGETANSAVKIDLPMDSVSHGTSLASSNGLLCVSLYNVEGQEKIYLWNPATRCHRLMPSLENQKTTRVVHTSIGFGYVDSADDYKIVKHRKTSGNANYSTLKFDVFSLKTGVWKTTITRTKKFKCPIHGQGTYFSGVLYWVLDKAGPKGVKGKARTIMAFDLETETHYELTPPTTDSKEQVTSVPVFQDCLCALFDSLEKNNTCELWMLKKHNATMYWNKLIHFPQIYIGQPLLQSVTGEALTVQELYFDISRVILSACNFEEGIYRRVFDFQVDRVQLTSVAVHFEGLASPYAKHKDTRAK